MTYENLKKWSHPECYMGPTWEGWYGAGVGQTRDSSALQRANFDAMLAELKTLPDVDVDGDSGLQVVREGHWAVGWVEWIAIHESNTAALELADKLAGKPVLDEDLFSRYEDEECEQTWQNCFNEQERADYLRKHVSAKYLKGYRELRAAVKGDWGYAAQLLPCPSDLLA